MTPRDPQRCCEAVRSAMLPTAWLLVEFFQEEDLQNFRWVSLWTILFADPEHHPVYWFGLVR